MGEPQSISSERLDRQVGARSDQPPAFDNRAETLLTPEEAAGYLKVSAEQVRSLIRRGILTATNVGTGSKRPLYRIKHQSLEDFLADRTTDSASSTVRRFKQRPPVPDFFPQLG